MDSRVRVSVGLSLCPSTTPPPPLENKMPKSYGSARDHKVKGRLSCGCCAARQNALWSQLSFKAQYPLHPYCFAMTALCNDHPLAKRCF